MLGRHGPRPLTDLDVPGSRYAALAVVLCLLWASAFVAIKIVLASAPPFFVMVTRFLVAGLLLLALARARGMALPTRAADWRTIAVLGLLNNALYLGVTAVALGHLSAGMGAILASTNPPLVALAAAVFLGERLTPTRAMGMIVSYGGVAWVMWHRLGEQNQGWAMALFLACTPALVAATLLFKRARLTHDLVVVNAVQCLVGGLALVPATLLLEDLGQVHLTLAFLAAQAYLVLGVACGAMLLWFWLLSHGGATRASSFFFLNPILALFLGAILLGEPLAARDFLGTLAVAGGIYLVQRT